MGLNWLTPLLQGSAVTGGLARFACTSTESLAHWLHGSVLGKLSPQSNASTSALSLSVQTWWWQILLLGVVGLFISFIRFDTGPIGCFVWFLLLLTLLSCLRSKSLPFSLTIIDLLAFLFIGSAIISTGFSSYLKTSVVGLAKMLTFVAGYLTFRTVVSQKPDKLPFLLGILTILGVFESSVGLYQYINHIQPLATWQDPSINPELQLTRIFGTLQPSNPNLLAGFLLPCLAAAGGLSFLSLSQKKWLSVLLSLGSAALIAGALVLTGSRGGYLALATMGLFSFAYVGHILWHDPEFTSAHRLRKLWLATLLAAGIGLLTVFSVSEQLQHRLLSIFAMREDSSTSYRMNVYASALRMFQDNLWLGIGPGNGTFKLVYGFYMIPGYNALGAYSVPLEIAVEQGLLGLGLFLLLMSTLALRTLCCLDQPASLSSRILLGTLSAGILASFVFGFFDTIWYRPAVNLLFWFFVAAFAVYSEAGLRKSIP